MARSFSIKEAEQKIRETSAWMHDLEQAAQQAAHYRFGIEQAVNRYMANKAYHLLKEVPIEEINRDRQGFRIKLLKEHGYQTVADIVGVSQERIAAMDGIGEDSARLIRKTVDEMMISAQKMVKVHLSVEHKTEEETALILALTRYRRSQKLLPVIQALLYNKNSFFAAVQDLEPVCSGLKRLFLSAEKKKRAENAYAYLSAVLSSAFSSQANSVLAQVKKIALLSDKEAWNDFETDPIGLFQLLEEIAPGLLGTDDAHYGLTEELAREIQQEALFLDGLRCELRRYQELGVKYILHQGKVLLGDEMGLGKTVQAVAAMLSLKNSGATHFIVVCPASILSNWCREIRKHSPLRVTKIHGRGRQISLDLWMQTGGVAVTTYETTDYLKLEDSFVFSMLIVDEAHYIKNPNAKRTIHVKEISRHAKRLLFMTGTALENNVEEMIELIGILQPQVAMSVKDITYLSGAAQFRERIAPVYYRRRREDVLTELPELIESKEWCAMNRKEERAYEEAILSQNYASARRVSWNMEDLTQSSKAQRMLELIEEAALDGRKSIVFSFFLDTIFSVRSLLGNRSLDPIHGSVSPERRQEIIDDFEKAPAGSVLVAQIQSGGTGLNIQSASVVILCEPQFKPSIENQAISRAYRMGQTRNVWVYRLLCEDTVDEKITELLAEKQALFDAFADSSVVAQESLALDERSFGNIMQEEMNRIQAKKRSV